MSYNGYTYPYYASFDPHAPQPTRITGWYNMSSLDPSYQMPPPEALIGLTQEEWDSYTPSQKSYGLGVLGGKIIPYIPVVKRSIQDQAHQALYDIKQQSQWMFLRGKQFGPITNNYIDILNDIIDGKISPAVLPHAPGDLTE